ncbi:hypothetical protein H4R33_001200 [Dimargaris cristalligena]|uniref:Uncharacterized protein n=1 Tax=Dimargaris cristalligena TaxID=215637 RepID=A0A4P9ZXE3_9FUNG|nr:hypothetical protein H4R33_001200 [Dimargaris cristalligena]RKP38365.1 hypothetical protein BJ085DRAFT_36209 [Dimargaris cristalligena]|eukprot:RKP38365.1 hypothetical protein BJ085DRAFT_36209 [Dimargaris cristalligena]
MIGKSYAAIALATLAAAAVVNAQSTVTNIETSTVAGGGSQSTNGSDDSADTTSVTTETTSNSPTSQQASTDVSTKTVEPSDTAAVATETDVVASGAMGLINGNMAAQAAGAAVVAGLAFISYL